MVLAANFVWSIGTLRLERVHKCVLLAVNDSWGPSYAFDVQLLRFPWGMQNSCDTPEKVPHTCSRDEDVVIPVLRVWQCVSSLSTSWFASCPFLVMPEEWWGRKSLYILFLFLHPCPMAENTSCSCSILNYSCHAEVLQHWTFELGKFDWK